MRILLIILSILPFATLAQDSLRIMYYNTLNFPDATPERADSIRKIIHYAKPDVFVINELQTEAGADIILTQSLNQFGVTSYQRAAFVDGVDTDNMLYYNSEKLGLISQLQIETTLRDFSEYVLYYKAPGLSAASDTVYFNFYSAHLKAGTGFFSQRADEAQILKFHLNTRPGIENVFVGGDFNFYSGNEEGCFILRTSGSVPLNDPINLIGDWSDDPAYASTHTQSTRALGFGGGSGGGMDDRFDLIFVSDDIIENLQGVQYINGSYQALGQDGLRYNQTINSPPNTVVPDSVADALYGASDHLPVMMDVLVDHTASLKEFQNEPRVFYNATQGILEFNEQFIGQELRLYSYTGRLLLDKKITSAALEIEVGSGVYLLSLDNYHQKIAVP